LFRVSRPGRRVMISRRISGESSSSSIFCRLVYFQEKSVKDTDVKKGSSVQKRVSYLYIWSCKELST
jgi:hypothetical protein